ncbi:hypothetical protein HCUR_00377 [Holospora curviuscula]|uniref:Tc1-like transposase DDE domain-containing protein n=1 Tax=Holospora curviuscula TaxID=1082868 RepID=A0A2S5RA31_9PROT|nr:hypothetical protein HCUR_00377 [Holospora curviuscula]
MLNQSAKIRGNYRSYFILSVTKKALIESVGCILIPYSSPLNPIEKILTNMKR